MGERLTVFYRTTASEGNAPRPVWYDRRLCLLSLCYAFDMLSSLDVNKKLVLLHDGELRENGHKDTIKRLVEPRGEIVELSPKQGNSKSCLLALEKAVNLSDEGIVLFSEDDYLWLPSAIVGLTEALTQIPADYATPYDHPVRYQPDYPYGKDIQHWDSNIYLTDSRHWRTQESTCMTFTTRKGTLVEDFFVFVLHIDNRKGVPSDRELFRHLQKLGKYQDESGKRRILVGPMPGLAVHVDTRGLDYKRPYVISWEKESASIAEKFSDFIAS
jgi:hypothetical protein